MNLIDYNIPYYYSTFDMFDPYYLSKDGWLLTKINKTCFNEYKTGDGFGFTVYRYDTSLVFNI